MAGVEVIVHRNNNDPWYWPPARSVLTDVNGDYTVTSLPSGDYKVRFNSPYLNYNTDYTSEWYNNKADYNSADPVTVTVPAITTGIDAVLERLF